jgi:hypothetical protein
MHSSPQAPCPIVGTHARQGREDERRELAGVRRRDHAALAFSLSDAWEARRVVIPEAPIR